MRSERVLIVEDEAIEALDLQHRLASLGFPTPEIAHSGEEGVRKAEKTRPDLVLLEILLPGNMDGIMAAEKIRSQFEIPVIYLTAYADENTVQRAKMTEPYGYIVKPFQERELNIAIEVSLYKSQMQRKLRESEEIFRGIFESSPIGIAICDSLGRPVSVNKAALEIPGLFEMPGESSMFSDPNLPKEPRERLRNGEPVRFQIAYDFEKAKRLKLYDTRKSGIMWLDMSITPFNTEQKPPGGYLIQFQDITEIKRSEQALTESERLLEILFASIPVSMLVLDKDRRVFEANEAAAQLAGRDMGEMFGLQSGEALQCLHSMDDPRGCGWGPSCVDCKARLAIVDTIESQRSHYQVEWQRPLMREGETKEKTFLLSTVPLPTARNEILVCLENITEQKRVEEELRKARDELETRVQERTRGLKKANEAMDEERQRFNEVLETLPLYLVLLTPDYQVPFANRFFRERFGKSHGRRCFEYLFGRTEPCEICETYKVLKTLAPLEWEWLGPDGRNYYVYDFPFTDTDGSTLILEMGVDVTEQKRAEEALRKAHDELEIRVQERTKELEAFTYSVSHDLRAPLRSIDGFSQALLEDYTAKLDEQGKDYLSRVRTASQRMGQLIDDMLALSRVTRSEMRHETVNMSNVAQAIADELRKAEPHRQIDFTVAQGLTTEGDPFLLRQLLENLLDNAVKFTSKHPSAEIKFGVMRRGGERVYYVRDDGAGFDMSYVDKLFGPFQRLHAPTEFPGTGIGLATVQRIVHRHGGRVWAEGVVEKGATVYFTLGTEG
ncbi:MAG: PAS domain S-box protein [Chloroflexi bacterium]|nr:PAS domain S-box protein [Chloroflexota bacterium]